ncbi:hypothetical protein PF003_g30068 [Phytophthora fragariae]|nr:hypothetical protein PF003_g30068 [Phytophthora fragariae]
MDREDPPTPKKRQLSGEMKDFIVASLDSGEKTTATKLYACIVAMVHHHEMVGPAPTDKQVADFVKNCRRDRPKYSMQPMIELCNAHLYDNMNLETLSVRDTFSAT